MSLVVNLFTTFLSVKFICCCWRNPLYDFCMTHPSNVMRQPKYRQIMINCGLPILIVSLFSLWRLRNTTQLRSGTVEKSKWSVFLQNTSGKRICNIMNCHFQNIFRIVIGSDASLKLKNIWSCCIANHPQQNLMNQIFED